MKKNFFKKLSFVLALAMIVTALAPAGGVFAAAKAPKLNATTKYLHLSGQPYTNEFDFNIANKQKGWKYEWTSANEKVAVVDKYGVVTAKGVGSTKVTVAIVDKDGELYDELSATVVVRDNIKTVDITGAPTAAIKANEAVDLGRSFTTLANSTKKTSSITRWTVDKATASITDAGLFKATEAGKYVVTARSFQSTEKYNAWKALNDTTSTLNVLATDSVEITVVASIASVKQINLTKFAVTFDTDMSKSDLSATTAKLFQVINGTKVNTGTEKIKEIKFDATGKVATVEMYSKFNQKTAYEFVYGDLTGTFTSAAVELKAVASIVFDDVAATLNTWTNIYEKVSGLDKDGVVIFNGKDDVDFRNALSFSGDFGTNGSLDTANKKAYVFTKGASATVTAKFSYYVYNETTKVFDSISWSDTAVVTGTEEDKNLNTASMQYVLKTGTKADSSTSGWAATGFTVAAKDNGYFISTRYKTNDDKDNYKYDSIDVAKFTYESSNTDKLIINGDYIYPIAEGVVTVLVKNNDTNKTVVGTLDITIQAARAFAGASIDNPSVTVGNNGTYGDDGKKATITVTDTLGAKAAGTASYNVSDVRKPSDTAVAPVLTFNPLTGDDTGKIEVLVNSKNATAGAYNYTLKVKHTLTDTTKDVYFAIVVIEGNSGDDLNVSSWRLELDKTTVDLKKVNAVQTINVGLYGYNTKGAKVNKMADTAYTVTVKKNGSAIAAANFDDTHVYAVRAAVASPAALRALEVNTYVVEAKVDATGVVFNAAFSVIDTTTKNFVIDDPTVASGSALAMVKEAISLYLNGDKVSDADEANIVEVVFNDGGADYTWSLVDFESDNVTFKTTNDNPTSTDFIVGSGESIFVKSVKYSVINSAQGTRTEYKYDINATIKAN